MRYSLFLKIFIFGFFFLQNQSIFSQKNRSENTSTIPIGTPIKKDVIRFEVLYKHINQNFFTKTARLEEDGKEAIILGLKLKDSSKTADIYRKMGVYYFFNGDYDFALKQLFEALALYTLLNDADGKSRTFHEIGTVYLKNLKRSDAIEIFDSCLKYAQYSKNPIALATAYNNFGIVSEYNKEYEKSFQYYDTAYQYNLQDPDSLSLSYSFENLGAIYLLQNKYDSAEKYLKLSQKYREELNAKQPTAYAYIYLGDLYQQKKKYNLALKMYQKCVDIGIEISYPDLIYRTYSKMSETYKALENYKKAYEYFYKSESYKDSIFDSDKLKQIAEMKTRFDVENQEKQYEILQKENQLVSQKERNKSLVIWFISILGILVLIGIFIYIRRSRQIQKIKTEADIMNAEAKQRLRISQDLHDNVGSQLSYVVTNLELAEKKLRSTENLDVNRIKAIADMSKQAIHTLRETVWVLNNNEISLESFYDKFKAFALKMNEFNIETDLNFEENITHNFILKPNSALNLFRICQEIFSNAIKHAQASKIDINLNSKTDFFEIEIKDNGIGFDISKTKEGHYGLSNIKSRTKELGASYKIDSKIDEGTTVILTFNFDKNTSDVVCI